MVSPLFPTIANPSEESIMWDNVRPGLSKKFFWVDKSWDSLEASVNFYYKKETSNEDLFKIQNI